MSQNKRPVRPGGMSPRSCASAQRSTVRPATVQVRSVSSSARLAASSQRPAANVQASAQRRPTQSAARPVRASSRRQIRLPYDFTRLMGIGLLVIALGVVGQMCWPNGFSVGGKGAVEASSAVSEIHGGGPIRLNELMSSNDGTAVDENGVTSDWIEVMNVSGNAVNLAGYTLAKNQNAANVFEFPDHTLQPGECALVYADSTLKQETGATYHAPFKLSSQGGTLMLFSASGTAVDSVNFPAMSADMSYARQDQSTWKVSSMATPGLDNTAENYTALHQARTDSGIEITEIVSANGQTVADENGEFYDYFEIHNTTGAAVDVSGWFASDTVGQPTKWRFPDGLVLQPGEYRIVYCSGLDRLDANHPHTNFSLSSEGEAVVLSDAAGRVVDKVEFGLLKKDVAWMKSADGTWTTGTPTPSAANG